ncbi:hypothetical protein [Mammaliicoccus sciuri]|uniref:phage baseplate protein n=1 Tax=Mammaliicoccus sciuri TaxID=1296 RepID=UPI000D1E7948|nr:hypothetical protein [Mammaliicoccus sciuri]PTK27520.1 hypothetical protein BUZ86_05425 [Mammaliicoccus sciuri]
MVNLIKSLDVMAGNVTRGQIMTNAQRTEDAINQQELAFNKHKTEDDNAHTTRQIKQGAKSQEDINKDLQSQISRLVLAPRNNSANEIVQARVNMFGEEFETLKDNINDWQERTRIDKEEVLSSVQQATKEVLDLEYRFEPDKQEFLFVTELAPLTNAVMQSFWFDNRKGIVYMTQARSNGYMLTRLRPNGQYIDSSLVIGGGHGTHNGYRYIDDELWIYSFIKNGNNQNTLVRFKYRPNVQFTYGSYGMEDVFTGHPERPYITPVINEEEGLILFRIEPTSIQREEEEYYDTLNYVEIRRLQDIDNKVDNVIHKFNIPMSLTSGTTGQPMQGVAFADDIVYWYTGDSKPENPNYITAFNANTGKQIYQVNADYGGYDGTFAGNFAEAEGLQMYYDRDTGKKALLLGVTVGGDGNRTHRVFMIGQRGMLEQLSSRSTPFIMSDTGGRVKPLPMVPTTLTNLIQLTEPGHYYLYTNHTVQIDDFPLPREWRDAGWYLDVLPTTTAGSVRQILTRNSSARNMMTFERIASETGNATDWNYIPKNSGKGERLPSFINKLSDVDIIGMSFYLTTDDTNRLSDFPIDRKGVAGWSLYVEASNTGGFVHRLVRSSLIANTEILIKNYNSKTNYGPWTLHRGEIIN